jgi:protein ImuA
LTQVEPVSRKNKKGTSERNGDLMEAAAETLAALRTAVARLEAGDGVGRPAGRIAFGPAQIDATLGGGVRRGALHAVTAAGSAAAPATGFAAALAGRAAGTGRAVLWIRQDMAAQEHGELWAPGLGDSGLDPSRLILLRAADLAGALRAAEAGLGSRALASVVVEPFGSIAAFDRIAGRRLALAAGRSGALALMLRLSATAPAGGARAAPLPAGLSAAETRWRVGPLSSAWRAPLGDSRGRDEQGSEDEAWARPQAVVELVRNRLGGLGRWPLVWGYDDGLFRLAGRLVERRIGPAPRDRGAAAAEDARDRAAGPVDRPRPAAGEERVRRAG